MAKEITNNEILEAINTFSSNIDQRFDKNESDISWIKSNMVTKDYLDDKQAELRGDLISVIRKENSKFEILIDVLRKRDLITGEDEKSILSKEPFPKLYV
jgi:hypothetical protein